MSHIQNFWKTENETNSENRGQCCGCCGCSSKCPANAIEMRYDREGFLYPKVDESRCIECGACLKICPIGNLPPETPYQKVYAGYTSDRDVLMQATSGGFATELSLAYVKAGGAVVGVAYSEDCVKTVYSVAHTVEEVLAFSGSKYVQSEKLEVFNQTQQELRKGTNVLFVGCPCDVYALIRFLGKRYDNLCTLELVCMGVSSYRLAEDYKLLAEKQNGAKMISINARSKLRGWFVPHLEENYENGKVRCSTLFGNYMGYGMQVYNRPSCFTCDFRGENGVGDIRIGDFWGIHDTAPYWNEDGVCCIFIRTAAGIRSLKILEDNGFNLYEVDYDTATQGNMSSTLNKNEKYKLIRDKFSRVYQRKGLVAACCATGTISFWSKHLVPDRYHKTMKKIYHLILDIRKKGSGKK